MRIALDCNLQRVSPLGNAARPRPRTSGPPPEASPYGRHIPALDGIRGFAVIAVMSSHLFTGTPRGPLSVAVARLLAYGAVGVDLFFVLSGFLITGILVDSLGDGAYFRKFYARRALRIFPLYYGVLAVFALTGDLTGMRFDHQLWSMALYLQNTHLLTQAIYDYAGPSPLPLAHFWSLAIEEQFYLVWPLSIFLVRRRRTLLLLCLAFVLVCPMLRVVLSLHGWGYFAVHTSTALRADSLLFGAALALLLRSRLHDQTLDVARWIALAGATGAIAVALLPDRFSAAGSASWDVALSLRYTSLDLLSVGLITLVLHPGILASTFRLPGLRFLGKYSYGLYVLHLPLFTYLQQPLRAFLRQHATANPGVGVAVTGIVTFLLSVAAAYASFHLYEKHFLHLKRFFSYGPRPPASLGSSTVVSS